MSLTDERLNQIVARLRERIPALLGVWLFGSRAADSARTESDVDLAVLAEAPLDKVALWETAQDLALLLGRDVDLLDLRHASAVMRMQVISKGRRIFCSDFRRCEAFEDFVFSDYARLNEERAEILADRLATHG